MVTKLFNHKNNKLIFNRQGTLPLVSVIMSVYNCEQYLADAVESILQQTYSNFEFIIIDDASTDNSYHILKKYNLIDKRIFLFKNKYNLGLTKTLNKGIKIAKGEYIARMDADDISLANRFEYQVKILNENPGVGVCGAWVQAFGEVNSNFDKYKKLHRDIARFVFDFRAVVFAHPVVMIRKSVLLDNNIKYDESCSVAQDLKLWYDLVGVTKFYNIQEVLLNYRVHRKSITQSKNKMQTCSKYQIIKAGTENLIKRSLTISEGKVLRNNDQNVLDRGYIYRDIIKNIKTINIITALEIAGDTYFKKLLGRYSYMKILKKNSFIVYCFFIMFFYKKILKKLNLN